MYFRKEYTQIVNKYPLHHNRMGYGGQYITCNSSPSILLHPLSNIVPPPPSPSLHPYTRQTTPHRLQHLISGHVHGGGEIYRQKQLAHHHRFDQEGVRRRREEDKVGMGTCDVVSGEGKGRLITCQQHLPLDTREGNLSPSHNEHVRWLINYTHRCYKDE